MLGHFLLLAVSLQTIAAQTHVGNLFNFVPGLGACGYTNTSNQVVASVSNTYFNTYPGATKNPNKNPLCKCRLLITSGSKNITVPVVDFYTDKAVYNVGLSEAGFTQFADIDDGVVQNVTWKVVGC